ncbi:MAG: TRAP transporter small permease subunit [Burkholderiales bacterium]|nr:TRAP transporter small permease subunit [Burkholderiales bacterium]
MFEGLRSAAHVGARGVAAAGALALLALSLAVVADVLMRWLFRAPLLVVADLAPLATAAAVAASFPFAISGRQHIAVTALGDRLGAAFACALNVLGAAAVLAFFALAAWQMSLHALGQTATGEATLVLKLPTAPAWWLVAAVLAFAALCAALDLAEQVRDLVAGRARRG